MNDGTMTTSPAATSSKSPARFSMAGRRALVTGGSVSIGRAIALVFADAGADVAIHYARRGRCCVRSAGTPREMTAAADSQRAACAGRGDRGRLRRTPAKHAARSTRRAHALGGVDVLVVCASIQYRDAVRGSHRRADRAPDPDQFQRLGRIAAGGAAADEGAAAGDGC